MKRTVFLTLALFFLFSPMALHAEDWPQEIKTERFFYLGAGGQYAMQNFRIDDPYDLNVNTENTWGAYLQAGYRYNKHLAAEFNFHWLPDFSQAGYAPSWRISQYLELDSSVNMYMGVVKVSPGLDSEIWKPYALLGAGYAYGNHNLFTEGRANISSIHGDWYSSSNGGAAVQGGVGVVIFPGNEFSIQLESNYFLGLGDVDMIRFGNISFGLIFPL